MKIVLTSDNKSLDEVIVTGYGNFKKSSFTGAAASMSTAKLSDVPSLSVEDKLSVISQEFLFLLSPASQVQ